MNEHTAGHLQLQVFQLRAIARHFFHPWGLSPVRVLAGGHFRTICLVLLWMKKTILFKEIWIQGEVRLSYFSPYSESYFLYV